MAGETPAVDTSAAAETGAAADLLEVAAPAEADKSAPEGAAPAETESKPADDKKAGDDGKGEAKAEADLLADDDEGKTPEGKDGQADKPEDAKPETYEALTLPEGVQIDEAALAQAKTLFGEHKIPLETANKLVAFYAQQQQEAANQTLAGFTQVKKDWQAAIKADAEFGGDKLPQTLGAAKAVLGKFGDKTLLNDLKEWGWANHPGFIKLLARVNAHLSEDTLVTADATTQAAPKSAAEIMWPGMFQKQE